ncbi:hypothetical protein Y032_0047g1524 [Ancylostoma ceylanicum]|uniref:Transmembrane protein n=1 Tax=Ancylostoma ceylanicum TaxID=53326 RepID=A0A016UC70_9BILA|nr:hypothetical protein Y032_0047g1524 [Ancylostoma ceylanicum]
MNFRATTTEELINVPRHQMSCPAAEIPNFGAVVFPCASPAFLLRKFRDAFFLYVSLPVNFFLELFFFFFFFFFEFLLLFFRRQFYSAAEFPKGLYSAAEFPAVCLRMITFQSLPSYPQLLRKLSSS